MRLAYFNCCHHYFLPPHLWFFNLFRSFIFFRFLCFLFPFLPLLRFQSSTHSIAHFVLMPPTFRSPAPLLLHPIGSHYSLLYFRSEEFINTARQVSGQLFDDPSYDSGVAFMLLADICLANGDPRASHYASVAWNHAKVVWARNEEKEERSKQFEHHIMHASIAWNLAKAVHTRRNEGEESVTREGETL